MAPKGKYALLHETAPARPAGGDQLATTATFVAAYAKEGPNLLPGVTTCYELFERSCNAYPKSNALSWRGRRADGTYGPYEYMTYARAHELAGQVAAGLKGLGVKGGERVGICAVNSPEWMLSMQGCNRMGYVCVPLYDTLGDEAVSYIVAHAEVRVILCGASKLHEVAKTAERLKWKSGGSLEAVVYWGEPREEALAAVKASVGKVLTWGELLAAGAAAPADPQPPQPDDLCTIMYTSGTTGNPKGVMITHRAVLTEVSSIRHFFYERAGKKKTEDATKRYFSFLTLAHIFDRVVEETIIMQGGCIGYFTGDLKRILEDVAEFRPTGFAGVPRVFDRIYAGALGKVKLLSPLRQFIFRTALAWKGRLIRAGLRPESASKVADALVFHKFKAALGGQCAAIISGGAPLQPHVQEFVQIAMSAPVLQGYGLTESCAASFVTLPWDTKQIGTVGPPMPGIEVRLEAVPELGYHPSNPKAQGEICLRGPALFRGYYKQADLTAEAVDADGFFHTGDIGEFTSKGLLKIIDRKKNIFKLAQGEYIAVETVEAALGRTDLVEQLWVYGNSFESSLVAVVVPNQEKLEAWAKAAGVCVAGKEGAQVVDYEALCASDAARDHVFGAILAAGKAGRLKGFELPRAILLEPELFSVDNDLMTPKFSLKRPQLLKHYQKQIDAMYAKLKGAAAH